MRKTLTIRLPDDLAEWLDSAASSSGVSQGQIVRQHLEKARAIERPFLRLAGRVSGPPGLSARKGFSKE